MNEGQWLKIVNPIIGILFIVVAVTGMFHSKIPWEVFQKVHGGGGILLTIGVVLHLWLNRHWFRAAYRRRRETRSAEPRQPVS